MQIVPLATTLPNPTDPVRPPLGIAKYGTLNVHYYLNGVVTKHFDLDGPLTAPQSVTAASFADAVAAARHIFDVNPPAGIALTQAQDGTYFVHRLNLDDDVAQRLAGPDKGPGYSWDITAHAGLRGLIVGDKVIDLGPGR